MNETSWQQEREISKARHSDFWMSLYREAENMNDEDNLEEYSWSIDPDIVRLADQCADLRAQLAAMTKRKDGWRLIALASLRECYAQWVGAEPRDTADYWHEFYLMNSEIRRKMEDVLAGVPIWKVRND